MNHDDFLTKSAWLLDEFARDAHALPLRLRILNMFTYTLDRLYMQAMPSLIAEAARDREKQQLVRAIAEQSAQMLNAANEGLRLAVRPIMQAAHVRTALPEECSEAERAWLAEYFARSIQPLLTPLAVDAGRPFPQISAHSLNLLAVIERGSSFDLMMPSFARLKIPRAVPRMIEVPAGLDGSDSTRKLILSEDMVRAHVGTLFRGMTVIGVHQFRLLRGAVQTADLPIGRHMALARQKAWPVVRIDVEQDMPDWVVRWLQENLEAAQACVLRRHAPLGMGTLAAEWAERVPAMAAR